MGDWFKTGFLIFALASMTERILEIARHRKRPGKVTASWTLIAMGLVHFSFYVGGLVELFLFNRTVHGALVLAGLSLFSAGFLLRQWVIRSLGELWSVQIEMRKEHSLVTEGPYGFSRHPNYLAILLELTGYCLMAHAWVTLIASFVAYSVVLFLRIQLEESELIRKFRKSYVLYRRKTPAFVPFPPWRKPLPLQHASSVFSNDRSLSG